jgi:hypothetical protein
MKNRSAQVRGLAAYFAAHTHTCCVPPTLNTAVRVEFMARHVPSQAANVTHALFVTLWYRYHLSNFKA